MRAATLALASLLAVSAAVAADLSPAAPAGGWSAFAGRAELMPRCDSGAPRSPGSAPVLRIEGAGSPIEYGGWTRTQAGITPGRWYDFSADYRVAGVNDERRQVIARLDWRDAKGERAGQPDYPWETAPDGQWTRLTLRAPAPEGAASVRIELILAWAPEGRLSWRDISLSASTPPPDRWVRLGTVSFHPKANADNVGAFIARLDRIAAEKPDIVCLGEEIRLEGGTAPYLSAAEPIPGPSTRRIGEAAKRHHMYVVVGLTERDGAAAYNTCVLIDRSGHVAGKYRKVYLPREEIEGGLTPGSSCPVFDTDFGRIGIMVCWDAEYPEPARALALRGAEVILVPAAGGYMTLLKARALENHLFVVSSGYDVESAIINPLGDVLFSTMDPDMTKVIPVNLGARLTDPWLGDMRDRFHKEIRPELYAPTPEPR
ncbi:MAG TPA: carbon-nitrogen hydrolase family protein [Opitutaceae bacterium]|jgi:predicted amidohydrolase